MIRKVLLVALLLVGGTVATASDDVGTAAPSASADPATTAASPAPSPAEATPTVPPDSDPGVILKEFPQSGPRNQVRLENKRDGRFLARSSISLHRSNPEKVQPMNIAIAEGRCTNCATFAVALQVFLYQRSDYIQPVNVALAVNNACTGCATIAMAIQYVIPVDDLTTTPENVKTLLRDMEAELRYFASVNSVSELDPAQVEARLRSFAERDAQLRQYLGIEVGRATADAAPSAAPASPSPTAAPASAEPTPAPTVAPSPADSTASPTPTAP